MSLEIGVMEMAKQIGFLAIQIEHLTNALKAPAMPVPAATSELQDEPETPPAKTVKPVKEKPAKPVKEKDKPKAVDEQPEPETKKEPEKKAATEEQLREALTAMQNFYSSVAKTSKEKDGAKDRARVVMKKFGGSQKISEIKPAAYAALIAEAKRIVATKDNSIVELEDE